MKQKFKNFFKGFIKNNYKLILFYIVLILLITIKLDYQIYSPGGLINLDSRIEIENSYKSEGSFNMTFVRGRKGNILFTLLSYVIPSWDLIPLSNSQIGNETEEEIETRNKVYLYDVSENAVAVAFRQAGLSYEIKEIGVSVLYVHEIANTNIKSGDVIISLENKKISNTDSLSKELQLYEENTKISLKVLRDNKEINTYAYIKNNDLTKIIGVSVNNKKEIITNPKVKFNFKNNEMGPSGGLMTALEIYDMLMKEDITKGRIIAGTGTIESDGRVGEISGVKYKLSGAVRKGSDIFICPVGNYEECEKEVKNHNFKIKLIKADTFENVLNKLK